MTPPRSLLFVPGGRPDMLGKVARTRPDAVAVDLEDAVAAADKDAARSTALAALEASRPGASTVLLRINPPGTPWHDHDLAAAGEATAAGAIDGVILPKYEYPEQLGTLRCALPTGTRVLVGLETGRGIAEARRLLAECPDAAYFGAEDYIADVGGRRTTGGAEVLYARSQVCLAARLAEIAALDQVVAAVHDVAAFRPEAETARDLGYRGKMCLHPTQVTIAHETFTPSAAEIAHARAVLTAADEGVGVVEGQMVDAAHIAMARDVLDRAEGQETTG
jgi:citrate lyase subunit beta/citryl-CoA lyase